VLMVCEIITFKGDEIVFCALPEGDNHALDNLKCNLYKPYCWCDFFPLYIGEFWTCPKNLIERGHLEHGVIIFFPPRGVLKFTYKATFW
jgi:hypothetical protein